MRKPRDLLKAFEKAQIQQELPDYFRNLQVVEALLQEARFLGILPLRDPLEGIEVDICVAEALRVSGTT
ncbi:MAG: hypothetical protein NZ742_08600 [Acidobacteria bacterium]|nr:hypothetical protein [Acidobacteriota bacterium]MDW7984879.1 hypothetical protein [Acidobacteriota bacterium]